MAPPPLARSRLQQLETHQTDRAAALAARAFLHTPCYTYIYEDLDEAQRLAALTWLFSVNIRLRIHQGGARCAFAANMDETEPDMVCFFMLQPPDAPEIGTLTMIRNGMALFPWRFGWRAFVRLLEVKNYHERTERRLHQKHKGVCFASLERMVVSPRVQGRGIGSGCLEAALAESAAAGHAVSLSTQSERNVKFYKRLGFEEYERDGDYFRTAASAGETNWTMVRHPPSKPDPAERCADTTAATDGSTANVCVGLLAVAACGLALMLSHPPDVRDAAASKPFTTFSEVRGRSDGMCYELAYINLCLAFVSAWAAV
jgi:GNAT superfamily N-acetyltransferase